MISLTSVLIVVAALTLVVVVMQITLRGSMPVARRLAFERVMMWGLYPALAVFWLVRGVFAGVEGEMIWALASGLLGLSMAIQCLALVRKAPALDGTRT